MELAELTKRKPAAPWSQGGKIPWHSPDFSTRMLREHLSQEHDLASRRFEVIDRHVTWLHETICGSDRARVLDLGCGPGFYTARLARLGHTCVGIDFSPASIEYARAEAERESLTCEYRLEDLRAADLGTGFDVVLFIFGEMNTFPPRDARALLARAQRCLSPGGTLVLEVHSESLVRAMGEASPTWYAADEGLFSPRPHLCLKECHWHTQDRVTTECYHVVSLSSNQMATYVSTTQAYSDEEYRSLLRTVGFTSIKGYPSLSGERGPQREGFRVLMAVKQAA